MSFSKVQHRKKSINKIIKRGQGHKKERQKRYLFYIYIYIYTYQSGGGWVSWLWLGFIFGTSEPWLTMIRLLSDFTLLADIILHENNSEIENGSEKKFITKTKTLISPPHFNTSEGFSFFSFRYSISTPSLWWDFIHLRMAVASPCLLSHGPNVSKMSHTHANDPCCSQSDVYLYLILSFFFYIPVLWPLFLRRVLETWGDLLSLRTQCYQRTLVWKLESSNEQMVYIQPRIRVEKWNALTSRWFWDANGSPNLGQMPRPRDSLQKKRELAE